MFVSKPPACSKSTPATGCVSKQLRGALQEPSCGTYRMWLHSKQLCKRASGAANAETSAEATAEISSTTHGECRSTVHARFDRGPAPLHALVRRHAQQLPSLQRHIAWSPNHVWLARAGTQEMRFQSEAQGANLGRRRRRLASVAAALVLLHPVGCEQEREPGAALSARATGKE